MTESLSLDTLAGVSDTLLIPLFCRIWEYEEPKPLLQDEVAYELGKKLTPLLEASPTPFHRAILNRRWPERVQILMALRTRHFDSLARDFLARHADAQVVMLGCGLDSRFERLGKPAVPWLNIDLPAVIRLRKAFFETAPQVQNLAISALEPDWLNHLDLSRPTLVIAEGLLMYLKRPQIQGLFQMLAQHLQGEFVCEVLSQWFLGALSRLALQWTLQVDNRTGFAGGLYSAREPETWDRRIHFLSEWTYFDQPEPRLGWMNLGAIPPFKWLDWIVRYRLGDL